jgi:hypothetical protein
LGIALRALESFGAPAAVFCRAQHLAASCSARRDRGGISHISPAASCSAPPDRFGAQQFSIDEAVHQLQRIHFAHQFCTMTI